MPRVILICWNESDAEDHARQLRKSGYDFRVYSDKTAGTPGLAFIKDDPPDAVVIDLARLPSQGRAVATWLRQRKATRHIPIVFVGGVPEKVEQIHQLLPDATFTNWNRLHSALRQAIGSAPAKPVVPGTMDSYAGTPLVKRLGIKADSDVTVLGAPDDFARTLGVLPPNVRLKTQARGKAHLILLFVQSQTDLNRRFPAAERAMAEGGGLWIVWPKKISGVTSDLTQIVVRKFGLDAGLVDYKICSIDKTWSGLLFTRRRERHR